MRKKKMRKKENENEKERKKEKYEKKEKISELPDSLKCIRNFKASRLKIHTQFSNHVQSDNEDFLYASGSFFAFCTCPLISSVCIFLFPLLDIKLFSNDLFDESR
jgi:hypothetical protein